MKKCVKCGMSQSKQSFYKSKFTKDKLSSWCKNCLISYNRFRQTGCDEELYNKLFEDQKGCCAICGKHQNAFKRALAADHCHTKDSVRGLLCSCCNSLLGKAYDNIEILEAAIKYLKCPPVKDKE